MPPRRICRQRNVAMNRAAGLVKSLSVQYLLWDKGFQLEKKKKKGRGREEEKKKEEEEEKEEEEREEGREKGERGGKGEEEEKKREEGGKTDCKKHSKIRT